MMKMKCEIPVTLMDSAIAFESILRAKYEDYSFGWQTFGEDDSELEAVYIVEKNGVVVTVVIGEDGTGFYACGPVNRWKIPDIETISFEEIFANICGYNYFSLQVMEDEDEGNFFNGEYHFPELKEGICSAVTYGMFLNEVLEHFLEESKAFDTMFWEILHTKEES